MMLGSSAPTPRSTLRSRRDLVLRVRSGRLHTLGPTPQTEQDNVLMLPISSAPSCLSALPDCEERIGE